MLKQTHVSPQQASDWACWMTESEDRQAGRRRRRTGKVADEPSGPFDPLRSSVSPDSGSLENDPKWGNERTRSS